MPNWIMRLYTLSKTSSNNFCFNYYIEFKAFHQYTPTLFCLHSVIVHMYIGYVYII